MMKFSTKTVLLLLVVLATLLLLWPDTATAQCAMCKAQMDGENGGKAAGTGLNSGILYLMAGPYIAASVVAFYFWRHYRKKKLLEQE